MFAALFKRAQLTVDNAIVSALTYVIMAVPFLLAAGFLVAYVTMRLISAYGPEVAMLIVAGAWLLIGIVLAAILMRKSKQAVSAVPEVVTEAVAAEPDPDPLAASMDRELVSAAITSVAPVALPIIMRILQRNLPLLAALGAAAFVFTRQSAPAGNKVAET